MKDWKIILVNGVITAVILFAGIKWLVPDVPSFDAGKIEETLAIQMERLQTRLNNMEQSLSKQKTPGAALSEQRKVPDDNLQKVERKLDVLLGKVTFLEQKLDATKVASGFGGNLISAPNGQNQLSPKMGGSNPINWVENLSPEKRSDVDMIFEEHGRRIREKLPPPSEGLPLNREAIRKIFRENDEELRENLREVLSDEEYQGFLDSLPKKRPPFPASVGLGQGSGGLR